MPLQAGVRYYPRQQTGEIIGNYCINCHKVDLERFHKGKKIPTYENVSRVFPPFPQPAVKPPGVSLVTGEQANQREAAGLKGNWREGKW